jgi:hypothetical protein
MGSKSLNQLDVAGRIVYISVGIQTLGSRVLAPVEMNSISKSNLSTSASGPSGPSKGYSSFGASYIGISSLKASTRNRQASSCQ